MIAKEKQLGSVEKDVSKELSLSSSDPNIRKLARRQRIQHRLSVLHKVKGAKDVEIIKRNPIERQILASTEFLEEIKLEGEEVISNVKVANDARELERRKEVQETREALLEKLERDNEECMLKYKEIDKKWSDIFASKDPLDIEEKMMWQNAKCLELLEKKDQIIMGLKAELENADLRFVDDLKKQNEDIDILIDRIDRQLNVIAEAYHKELDNINNVLDAERKLLLDTLEKKWKDFYEKLQDNGHEGIEKRKDIIREYEEEMERVMTEHHEEYRSQKITLALENQELQQKLQDMKALCMLNVEKLNYSYAVLKHKDEENTIIKNEQKRRINKLQDTMNELRKTYVKLEEDSRSEIQGLTDQVLKAHKNILELEEKSQYFTDINEKKYFQVWDMNVKRVNELVDKIMATDRIIHEQALGLQWQPPEVKLLTKEDLPSYCTAINIINKEKTDAQEKRQMPITYKKAVTLEDINLERRLLNHIMEHISEKSNYLIDDNIQKLLLPYTTENNVIIRLDNVFQALNIISEEEIQFLLNFFLPYTYCPDCMSLDKTTESSSLSTSTSNTPLVCGGTELDEETTKLVETIKAEVFFQDVCSSVCTLIDTTDYSEMRLPSAETTTSISSDELDVSSISCDEKKDSSQPKEGANQLLCKKGHLLKIDASYVTRALKEFIEKYNFIKRDETPKYLKERLSMRKVTISRSLTVEDIKEFWKRYRDLFPPSKESLWDGLLVGLKRYYETLKERQRLSNETASLKKQNAELRRLLKTYNTVEIRNSPITDTEISSSAKT
ncbi:dynein regulatory complex protein 1 [Vespa crabro]|uniref:dynein regulatory complex protein 1 n=1 Tax=Vespa crabro TaxID=7445 RepID=UPI001F0286C3|nr:dynein regulatory complex protein 1 [Vespa crabro]XP_046831241.1 dynein regulatory complex protein 1 [Vespa crabro]